MFDALPEADTSASSGFGPWNPSADGHYASWSRYLLENVYNEVPGRSQADWGESLHGSAVATRAFEAGMQALESLVSHCPDQRSLVHSDLLNRNVFVSDGRVSGLIDWQCAMYGDFLYVCR